MILLMQSQSEGMFQPLQNALSTFLSYIPQLIGALIILIVGYIVAKVLQAVVGRVLQGIGFDRWMERGGIKQFFDRAETNQTPASILGALVFWFVFIIAITMAADALGIPQVSVVLAGIGALLGLSFLDNLSGVTLPSAPSDAPQGLGTILTGAGILALLAPFIGGVIGGALGARTGRRRP